jgi:hypothetical protein
MDRIDPQSSEAFDVAAHFIAAQTGGVERILTEHRPNDSGLCCGCTRPGVGTPYVRWPCAVAKLAQSAGRPPACPPAQPAGPVVRRLS